METNSKILIVEDDKYYAHLLRLKFETEHFQVKIARDGKEMLEELPVFNPDLIILDLVMPVMNGFDALEKMQNLPQKPTVIVLTNLGQDEDVERARKLGAADYVVKSNVSIDQVVATANKYLSKK